MNIYDILAQEGFHLGMRHSQMVCNTAVVLRECRFSCVRWRFLFCFAAFNTCQTIFVRSLCRLVDGAAEAQLSDGGCLGILREPITELRTRDFAFHGQ